MPLLFTAAPALVPCLSASSPDVIVAPALIPFPSASALACRCCCRRHLSLARQRPCLPSLSHWLSSLACQRPPSPAVVVVVAATNGSGHARLIVAARRRSCRPFNLRCPAPPQSLLPPSPLCRRRRRQISCFLGEVPFHVQRNHITRK